MCIKVCDCVAVPCDAGYHLPSREMTSCVPCRVGTYQDEQGQTSCKPCLDGSTTLTEASDHPVMCNIRVTVVLVNTTTPAAGDYEDILYEEEDVEEEDVDDILSVV